MKSSALVLIALAFLGCAHLVDTKRPSATGRDVTVDVSRRCDAFPSPIQTSATLRRDGDTLVFAFVCQDAKPVGPFTRRDEPLWEGDVVEVFLAPGAADPTDYFEFEVSPNGTLFDARVHNPEDRHESIVVESAWNCQGIQWSARVDPKERQWRAELRIPISSLGVDPAKAHDWRLGLYRIDQTDQPNAPELLTWSPTLNDPPSFHRPSRFGYWRTGGSATPAANRPTPSRGTPR